MKPRYAPVPLWQIAMARREHEDLRGQVVALAKRRHGPSAIANALSIKLDAVKYQLRKYRDEGFAPSTHWTEREERELSRLAESRSPAEIARALGRTEGAVRARASRLGITWGRAA